MSGQATPFSLWHPADGSHRLLAADLLTTSDHHLCLLEAVEDIAVIAQCRGSSKISVSERRAVIVSLRSASLSPDPNPHNPRT